MRPSDGYNKMMFLLKWSRHLVLVFAVPCIVVPGVIGAGAQTGVSDDSQDRLLRRYGDWRKNWGFRVTTVPAEPVVADSVIVTIKNQTRDTLRAFCPMVEFSGLESYEFLGLDVCTDDSVASSREYVLPPGDSIIFRSSFQLMATRGAYQRTVDTAKLFAEMRAKPWRLRAFFSDLHSPKPMLESNLNVLSDWVECNSRATKRAK